MENQFPIEIWKHILCHLDKEHLKQCLLISRQFQDVIIKTPQLMRKLPVIFFNDTWERKVKFIEEYGSYVRVIKFDDCGFREMKEVRSILKLTPNVESLMFYNCYIIESTYDVATHENEQEDLRRLAAENHAVVVPAPINPILERQNIDNNNNDEIAQNANVVELENENNTEQQQQSQQESRQTSIDNEEDEVIELPKLNFLHLDSCNIAEKLVKNLRNCNTLKSLKITFYYQAPVNFFTEFLCQQKCLEELHCIGWSDMVFKSLFKEDISKERIQFKLKKFTLECELGYHENFSRFLRSQAKNFLEFDLMCYNINFHYYRLLFNHFHSLRKLTLPTDWFLTDERVRDIKNCRIESLRELELLGSNDDVTTFTVVMNIFPNVEYLKAENLMYFSLHGILEKFTKLKTIKADNFRVETMLFTKIPSLKVLEIAYLFSFAMSFYWEKLAEDCENIERLIITDIGHYKLNQSIKTELGIIVRSLSKFKKLKYCEIISSPQDPMVNGDQDQQEVHIPHEHPFYKIIVENFDGKPGTIRISQYFSQHCEDYVDILKETFNKCDIIQI